MHLKVENFLNKIIQNHLNEKKLDDSKDFLDILLSPPRENGSNHRLEDDIVGYQPKWIFLLLHMGILSLAIELENLVFLVEYEP
jgi:hypothetical protein